MRIIIYAILILLLSVSSGMSASISDYTADTSPASGDLVVTVDVSDTTMASSGTNKKVTLANLISAMMSYGFSGSTIYPTFTILSAAGGSTIFQVDHSGTSMIVVSITDEDGASGTSNQLIFRTSTGIKWISDASASNALGGLLTGTTNSGSPTGTWDFTGGTFTASNANILSSLSGSSDYILSSNGSDGLWIGPTSAREALGLVIGTNVQAYNADLDSLSGVGNDKIFYSDGSGDIQELTLGTNGLYLQSAGTGSAPIWATATVSSGGSGATWFETDDNEFIGIPSGGTIYMAGKEGIETTSSNSGSTLFFEVRADGGASKYFLYSGVTLTGDMLASGFIYWMSATEGGVTVPAISGSTPAFVFKDATGAGVTIFSENGANPHGGDRIAEEGSWGDTLWLPPGNMGGQISMTAIKAGVSSYWDVIGKIDIDWELR